MISGICFFSTTAFASSAMLLSDLCNRSTCILKNVKLFQCLKAVKKIGNLHYVLFIRIYESHASFVFHKVWFYCYSCHIV
jgi:hypothetical protein